MLKNIKDTLLRYLDLSANKASEADTVESIISGTQFKGTNLWILVCAIFIASLGLNVNSIPVIIGAMLISPLMGPIMGIGLSLAVNDGQLLKNSAKNLAVATLFALLTSCVYFLVTPLSGSTSELLARTQPTIYDIMIAFFGGFAGIIALGSNSKGNVLPGVAIATALMPPLCTAGYGLATLQPHFFFGAGYLFLINCVYIGIATWLGVRILRLPKHVTLGPVRQKQMMRIVTVALILVAVPSVFTTIRVVKDQIRDYMVRTYVHEAFSEMKGTEVVSSSLEKDKDKYTLKLSLVGKQLCDCEIRRLDQRLDEFFGTDIELSVIQTEDVNVTELSHQVMHNVLNVTMMQLNENKHRIDSLSGVISSRLEPALDLEKMVSHLREAFPEIRSVSVAPAAVLSTEDMTLQKQVVEVCLYVHGRMSRDRLKTCQSLLESASGNTQVKLTVRNESEL